MAANARNNILKNNHYTLISPICKQFDRAKEAQKAIDNLNIPHFLHTKVVYFNGEKLLLSTNIPELLAKSRELEVPLIKLMRSTTIFRRLSSIKLQLYFQENLRSQKRSNPLSHHTKLILTKFADKNKNSALSISINKLIKHGKRT